MTLPEFGLLSQAHQLTTVNQMGTFLGARSIEVNHVVLLYQFQSGLLVEVGYSPITNLVRDVSAFEYTACRTKAYTAFVNRPNWVLDSK